MVAEIANGEGLGRERTRRSGLGEVGEEDGQVADVERESWRMLDWICAQGELSQGSKSKEGCLVVGFAIWNVRVGHAASTSERERLAAPAVDFRTSLRGNWLFFRH